MGILGKITKTSIDKDSKNIIVHTVIDNSAISEADLICSANETSIPLEADLVLLSKVEGIGQYVAVGVIAKDVKCEAGEKIIYSRSDSEKMTARIYLKNDGKIFIEASDDISIKSKNNIIMNDGKDYAVKFEELEKEMKKLKEQLNGFIDEYNAHIHASSQGPTQTPSVPSTTTITLDITQAKSETINIP